MVMLVMVVLAAMDGDDGGEGRGGSIFKYGNGGNCSGGVDVSDGGSSYPGSW